MSEDTILITAPSVHPEAVALLAGYRLVYTQDKLPEAELVALVEREQPVAILARYGHFNERVMAASKRLKIVSRHGVGMDAVDREAAQRLGIAVTAAVGSNSQAVAELAIGMMISCARQVNWLDDRMRQGHWDKDGYQGLELSGKTLGLVGCGSIGSRVARIALAIGLNVRVVDPYLRAEALPSGTVKEHSLDEMLPACDLLTFHCPLTTETRGMLDARRLGLMRPRAIVVNTARAGIFDESAMLYELEQGRFAVGLDCFVEEPLGLDSPWRRSPRTVLTPHIGGTTDQGLKGMGVGAARNILSHLRPA